MGRAPKLDLEALLAEQSAKMTPADIKAEAVRCGSELTQTGKEIQIIGQHLVERGKQLQLQEQQEKQYPECAAHQLAAWPRGHLLDIVRAAFRFALWDCRGGSQLSPLLRVLTLRV
jgi:hypothetical protein